MRSVKSLFVFAGVMALGCAYGGTVETSPEVCDGRWGVEVSNRFDQTINVDYTREGEVLFLGEVSSGETRVFHPRGAPRPQVTVRPHEDYHPRGFRDRSAGLIGVNVYCEPPAEPEAAPTVEIDHIIVAIPNLQEGMRLVEELTGVRPVFGGEHPRGGTQNALISLGPRRYLEILAPQTGAEPAEALEVSDLTPMGWASSTASISGTLEWLQRRGYGTSTPTPGSRARPDGATLMWTTMGITDPAIAGAPFFIMWSAASEHPATTSPAGCELRSLTVRSPDSDDLERLVRGLGLDVVVEAGDGPAAELEVVLACPNGTVVLK